MDGNQLVALVGVAIAAATLISGGIVYFVSSGSSARRKMLEQDVTDLEKRLALREHERDEARHERDLARQELDALGRVVTAASAIERFERALADHRAELLKSLAGLTADLKRIYDLIMSFRTGGRREQ